MLEALIAEQVRSGFSDAVFADSLGIPRTTWYATRTGARHLTPRVIRAGVKAFPHLKRKAVLFLLSDNTQVPEIVTSGKDPSNIDAEASEATRTLVLTQRHTIACAQTETARAEQDQGGSLSVQSVPRTAGKCYVSPSAHASALASRAADAEAG